MIDIMQDALLDTLIDCAKLIPFLFLTYLLMEIIEHKTSEKARLFISRAGYAGPVAGGILGVIPQCGFSAAAASMYAGKIITLGTLLSVFLSTSDEMLPMLISEQVPIKTILSIIGTKALIGIVAGFAVDFLFKGREHMKEPGAIHSMCEHEHCKCEKGIFRSALMHTLTILAFIALVSLILNLIIMSVGEENIAAAVVDQPILGPILAGIIGLLPNCAASVALTELYLKGILSVGTMIAGLLVGAGVGILVLAKLNHSWKNTAKVITLLYCIGVVSGIILNFI